MLKIHECAAFAAATVFMLAATVCAGPVLSILSPTSQGSIAIPTGPLLMDSGGNLIGTTYEGGAKNLGTVFEWSAASRSITRLTSLDATTGANPETGLWRDPSGVIYGTALS